MRARKGERERKEREREREKERERKRERRPFFANYTAQLGVRVCSKLCTYLHLLKTVIEGS